ncbi:hypothetical protein FRC03_004974 [Tulasnella sp. 419]|nr:hypothetical protein FRC03_004974 [Tulasnella sp. 419]
MFALPPDVADRALSLLLESASATPEDSVEAEGSRDPATWKAEDILSVVSAFNDHAFRRVTWLRKEQNLRSPANLLPSDVLADVFLSIYEESAFQDRFRVVTVLAAVSSWWRSVAISDARLWVCLADTFDPKINRLMLERSKQASLCLSVSKPSGECEDFLDLVAPQMSRWREFETAIVLPSAVAFKHLQHARLPKLERLVIAYDADLDSPAISLNIYAPILRELVFRLSPFPLPLQPGLHSKLSDILFYDHIKTSPFTLDHYGLILASAPHLRRIHIHGCVGQESNAGPLPMADIHLPHLDYLALNHVPCAVAGYLISSISTTPDRYPLVDISTFHVEDSLSNLFSRRAPPNSLLGMIRTCSWISIQIDDRTSFEFFLLKVGIEVLGVRMTLLALHMTGDIEILEQILYGLGVGSGSQLKVVEVLGLGICYGLIPILSHLSSLETLCIRSLNHDEEDKYSDLSAVLSAISSSEDSEDSMLWICPRLRYLIFDTAQVDVGVLIRFIESRTSEQNGGHELSESVSRLERVEVSDRVNLKTDPLWDVLEKTIVEGNIGFGNMSDF